MSKWPLLFVLLFFTGSIAGQAQNPVSNQEIRDAILSLIHSYSLLDNKLERHEQRERNLGELIKKGLMTLQKNQRIFEPIKGSFERLENRISQIETFLIRQDEHTSNQQIKLIQTLEEIMKLIDNVASTANTPALDENLVKKFTEMDESLSSLHKKVGTLKIDKSDIEQANKNLVEQAEKLSATKKGEFDQFFEKLEEKLNQFYITDNTKSEFEEKVTNTVDNIKSNVEELKKLYSEASKGENGLSDVDRKFIEGLSNDTVKNLIQTIVGAKADIVTDAGKNLDKTENAIVSAASVSSAETAKDMKQLEKLILDISSNYDKISKRFEYGIQQIALEIKQQTSKLNQTVYSNSDGMQSFMVGNLSSKVENELTQVWRQIGIMSQEIMKFDQNLNNVEQSMGTYINDTHSELAQLDNIKGKVSLITGRMQEVDSNLNYLLGRLSLVTQEFNQIKSGLGQAFDEIKQSFMTIQEKVKDVKDMGPGPHPIEEPDADEDENDLRKRKRSSYFSFFN